VFKERRIILDAVEIIGRPIEKMVLRRIPIRVIRRPDPREGCDIRELSHRRVRHVSVTVTVGIILERRIQNAAAFANLNIGSKGGIADFAVGMNKRFSRREFRHDYPLMNFLRIQPEIVSMIITVSTTRIM
jgi:hypothetical protein